MRPRLAGAALLAGLVIAVGLLGPDRSSRPPSPVAQAQERVVLLLPMALRGPLPPPAPARPTYTPESTRIRPTRTSPAPTQAPPLGSPTPWPTGAGVVTSHPRLWVTLADLPRLRSWATTANPMFARGLAPAAEAGRARADAHWSWTWRGGTGLPDEGWQDKGSREYERDYTEAYAMMFAFMALVDPDAAARAQWAGRARDMLMWMLDQAALGPLAGAPFRDPVYATFNRANSLGMAIPLTVDWIYPTLSAADKATIRAVFLRWSQENLSAYPISSGPLTQGELVDDLALLGSSPDQSEFERASAQRQLRWVANNYWLGHMRVVTLMALSFDPADDPGGALTGQVKSATGHWLYAAYAMFGDRAVVERDLGVPPGNTGIGLASGGLPVEGTLYGESLGFLMQTLLALHTAGYADPVLAGPQAALVHSPLWDRVVEGFLHSISPESHLPDPAAGKAWLGRVYWPATYGDLLRNWVTWQDIQTYGPMGVLDQRTGNVERHERVRWILEEALEGGPSRLYSRAANIWGNGFVADTVLYFLNFPPGVAAAPDPRPALPLTFIDRPYGRLLSRTDWGPDARWLTFKCSWMTINHQNGDGNQFELYRKGEWLTKERSGYADDAILMTSDYHNTLALQNTKPAKPNWFEDQTIQRGGQWTNGSAAGDPTTTFGVGDGYVFARGDATNLYNRPPDAMDIRHASRDLLWLQPDTVVVYDRADSETDGRFKRFNLTLLALPTVQGRTAIQFTPGGQRLTIQSLLPEAAVLTASPAERFNTVADLEPSQARLVIEDPSGSRSVRFLHLLRAADADEPAEVPATLVRGEAIEGAAWGEEAALFASQPGDLPAAWSIALPAATRRVTLTGLRPGAGYTVELAANAADRLLTVREGGPEKADEAGVLRR